MPPEVPEFPLGFRYKVARFNRTIVSLDNRGDSLNIRPVECNYARADPATI
jgi:hypothetical protein